MTPLQSGRLTRIGFRRDVKLFLAALVGYLIVMILALLLTLQNSVIATRQAAEESWGVVASIATRDLDRIETPDKSIVQHHLSGYVELAGLISAELVLSDGRRVRAGYPGGDGELRRVMTRHGELALLFDDSFVRHEQTKFKWVAIIVIVGSLGVTTLLVLYLPRIVSPIEEMLDHASEVEEKAAGVDEARYLVETFKRSLDTLREQRDEISRLHAAERTRAADLERVASTLKRSIASGFLAVDVQGRVVDTNRVACDMLGIDPSPGEPLSEAFPAGRFASDLARSFEERESLSRHETHHPRGVQSVPIGLTTVPLRDEEGAFIGMIAIFTDLTPIRSLEGRVRELQTLADLGEISAGIAHEFRNSLATVLGYLRLARRDAAEGEARSRVESAEHEANLLSEAVTKLLRFSRPIEPDFRDVDLADIATDVVTRLGPDIPEGVTVALDVEHAAARGDAALLRIVVENLVRNAVDAVRERSSGARVEIVTRGGPEARLDVIDNGEGIDGEDTSRIFLPFQSGKPGGFGLGLALSRKIVLLHGGNISLRNGDDETVASVELPTRNDQSS